MAAEQFENGKQVPGAHSAPGTAVSVQGASKTFYSRLGTVRALTEITTDISEGEFLAIIGPSGCGKSTLLNLIAGLDQPTTGTIEVYGKPVERPVIEAGVVFQRDLLMDWRNALQNVLVQLEMRGQRVRKEDEERARELLASVGLERFADRYPRELSGGMRQRVALCRALVHDPILLLMDEPFGALDAMTRDQLNLDLSELTSQTKKTVVFITHSIEEGVFLGDRVMVMSKGPGEILADIRIDLPRPRSLSLRDEPEFARYARQVREVLDRAGVYHLEKAERATA